MFVCIVYSAYSWTHGMGGCGGSREWPSYRVIPCLLEEYHKILNPGGADDTCSSQEII